MPVSMPPMTRAMSPVIYKNMRFFIFDAPTDPNLSLYLEELQSQGVTDIFRVCEPTYRCERVNEAGIQLTDSIFPDGTIPPAAVVSRFLNLCNHRFPGGIDTTDSYQEDEGLNCVAIGIHCISGLGRAPILVAIALIESGMSPQQAVDTIRTCRRGSFNLLQQNYLLNEYKPTFHRGISLVPDTHVGKWQ
ncbi:Protein tyrosine phosphatase prl-1 [Podochytrium sp. JEL0797]|nr:Protein tyrosine phosphatase prl-1 [Podochytrium sp. JEL0797]